MKKTLYILLLALIPGLSIAQFPLTEVIVDNRRVPEYDQYLEGFLKLFHAGEYQKASDLYPLSDMESDYDLIRNVEERIEYCKERKDDQHFCPIFKDFELKVISSKYREGSPVKHYSIRYETPMGQGWIDIREREGSRLITNLQTYFR